MGHLQAALSYSPWESAEVRKDTAENRHSLHARTHPGKLGEAPGRDRCAGRNRIRGCLTQTEVLMLGCIWTLYKELYSLLRRTVPQRRHVPDPGLHSQPLSCEH